MGERKREVCVWGGGREGGREGREGDVAAAKSQLQRDDRD